MKRKVYGRLPWVLAVALVSMGVWPAGGQESAVPGTNVITLNAAIRLALMNNPEIRVLAMDIDMAQGAVVTARVWQNPDVFVAPGVAHVREPSDNQLHANIDLQQAFEWPGKRALRKALAEKDVVLRRLALDGFRAQLAIQVHQAYLTLLVAHEVVTLREQRLALAQSFVDAARKRAEGGFAPEFEATKAEMEVVAAHKSFREGRAQADAAHVALNALMGRLPAEPLLVTGSLTDDFELPGQARLLESAFSQNPAVKVQEAAVERTGLNLQSIRKSRLPNFKVGPSAELTRDEQIVGLGVSLPLPLWDNKQGEIAAAKAEQGKALAELEKLRLDIMSNVTLAAQNFIAARESLTFYTPELREKLKSVSAAAARNYAEGKTSFLIYLESQRTCFDLQADYFETLKKLFAARAELESAMGVSFEQFNQLQTKVK